MHRREALRLSGRFEPAHLSLALARRLMGEFGPIVLVLPRAVHDRWHRTPMGCGVAAQLVRDHTTWRTALPFQQLSEEAFGGVPITPGLHEDVEDVAVVIDGAPKILLMPPNRDEQFAKYHMSPRRPCRCRRVRAYAGPNVRHHCRMVS